MATLKHPTSFEEQLKKLKSRGVVVSDDTTALNVLRNISYYRLTVYLLHKRDIVTHQYEQGTTFDEMVKCQYAIPVS